MISSQNAMNSADFHEWANTKKDYAQTLCKTALESAQTLFQNGDLRPYLDLLSRLHAYNFYNLLLILQQYPEASCLATFQEWKKQGGEPNKQVLKNEHKGNGIELIAPFTEPPRNKKRVLFWYSVKQFDLSQTLVSYDVPKSIYDTERQNAEYIEQALRQVLSQEHHCVFLNAPKDQMLEDLGSPGFRTEKDIYCNTAVSSVDRILWFLEILLDFSDLEHMIGSQYSQQFTAWVTYCLLRIWRLSEHYYLHQDADLIRSIPKNQHRMILDQLQVFVRRYEELVHGIYLEISRVQNGSAENDQPFFSIAQYKTKQL